LKKNGADPEEAEQIIKEAGLTEIVSEKKKKDSVAHITEHTFPKTPLKKSGDPSSSSASSSVKKSNRKSTNQAEPTLNSESVPGLSRTPLKKSHTASSSPSLSHKKINTNRKAIERKGICL